MPIHRWFRCSTCEYHHISLEAKRVQPRLKQNLELYAAGGYGSWNTAPRNPTCHLAIQGSVLRMSKSTNTTDVLSLVRKFLASLSTRLATLSGEVLSPVFLSFPCRLWRQEQAWDYKQARKANAAAQQWQQKHKLQNFYLGNKLYRPFSADNIPKPVTAYIQTTWTVKMVAISSITFLALKKHLPSNNSKSCTCSGDTNSLAHIWFWAEARVLLL